MGMTDREMSILAREITEKVRREVSQQQIRPATVAGVDDSTGWGSVVQVHLDGDPPDHTVPAQNMTGGSIPEGARVMVTFEPPAGIFVTGLSSPSGSALFVGESTPVDSNAPDTSVADLTTLTATGGWTYDSTVRGIVVPVSGEYSMSATVVFTFGATPT